MRGLLPIGLLALVLAGSVGPAVAAPGNARTQAPTRFQAFRSRAKAFGLGVVRDGPIYTWQSIRDRPKTFAAALTLTGLLGATAQYLGVSPDPIVLSMVGGALVVQMGQSFLQLHKYKDNARWRFIGSHLVWPPLLVGAGGWAGVAAGDHAVGHVADPQAPLNLAQTFGRSILMGGDEPAIFMMALPPVKKARAKKAAD